MTLRIASYNVHKAVGLDRRRDPGRVLSVIARTGADIVALQEVDRRLAPRPTVLPRTEILRHTGYEPLGFVANGAPSLGWHGQTILVRRGIGVIAAEGIELPGLEPRGAVMAELETPEGALRVVGVHLALLKRWRLMQIAAIHAAVAARVEMATVIIGDFNDWSTRGSGRALADGFRLHAPGRSFPANRPLGALDRAALGPGVHLRRAEVVSAGAAPIASDHLPILIEVALGD